MTCLIAVLRWLMRDFASGRRYRDLDAIDGTPNPWLQRWLRHPAYDAYWQAMVPYRQDFARIGIPVLTVTGYYDDAQLSPATVGLVEAHATGTAVGERTELTALGGLLADHGAEPRSVAIGSVKSQIGHTKGAAGTASLIAHPGLSNTDLQAVSVRQSGGGASQRFFHMLARRAGMPAAAGALSQLRAATDPAARNGEFYGPLYVNSGPPVRKPILRRMDMDKAIAALWQVSERETGMAIDLRAPAA